MPRSYELIAHERLERNGRSRSIHFLFEPVALRNFVTFGTRCASRFPLDSTFVRGPAKTFVLFANTREKGHPVPFRKAIDFRVGQTIPFGVLHKPASSGFSGEYGSFYFSFDALPEISGPDAPGKIFRLRSAIRTNAGEFLPPSLFVSRLSPLRVCIPNLAIFERGLIISFSSASRTLYFRSNALGELVREHVINEYSSLSPPSVFLSLDEMES